MKKKNAPFALLAAAALLTGCDDSDQHTHNPTVYNIVELASRDESGTEFLYYPAPGDTPETLRAATRSAVAMSPGESLFLGYAETGDGTEEGVTTIEVKAVTPILNTEARIATAEEIQGWDAEPVYLLALWRAGDKAILRCLLTADSAPRHFGLLVDGATLADPVPTAYLYHRRDTPVPNYTSQYYTAFSLAPVRQAAEEAGIPAPAALRIRVANAANRYVDEITLPL